MLTNARAAEVSRERRSHRIAAEKQATQDSESALRRKNAGLRRQFVRVWTNGQSCNDCKQRGRGSEVAACSVLGGNGENASDGAKRAWRELNHERRRTTRRDRSRRRCKTAETTTRFERVRNCNKSKKDSTPQSRTPSKRRSRTATRQ